MMVVTLTHNVSGGLSTRKIGVTSVFVASYLLLSWRVEGEFMRDLWGFREHRGIYCIKSGWLRMEFDGCHSTC
jgi:hypothetical protein